MTETEVINFHTHCRMGCLKCGKSTIHEKIKRSDKKGHYKQLIRKCSECGNEVIMRKRIF